MKIFQINNNICYWDATKKFPTLKSLEGYFPPDVLFVEAPDYVFEGWGYLNGEFIKPTAPEGWIYDDETGTFYQDIQEEEVLKTRYRNLCATKIAKKYSNSDENQVLREYLTAPNNVERRRAFLEYNAYVEQCLKEAHAEVYKENK